MSLIPLLFGHLSCVWLFREPVDCSSPVSSVHGISQQEYWSGLPFLFPGIFLTHSSITVFKMYTLLFIFLQKTEKKVHLESDCNGHKISIV